MGAYVAFSVCIVTELMPNGSLYHLLRTVTSKASMWSWIWRSMQSFVILGLHNQWRRLTSHEGVLRPVHHGTWRLSYLTARLRSLRRWMFGHWAASQPRSSQIVCLTQSARLSNRSSPKH